MEARRARSVKLVIFDKDGTLINFNFTWSSWAEKLADQMARFAHEKMAQQWGMKWITDKSMVRSRFFQKLGYDDEKQSPVSGGMLCCVPMPTIKAEVIAFLLELMRVEHLEKVEDKMKLRSEVEQFMTQHFSSPMPTEENTKLNGDVKSLFSWLKGKGVKIAICTTDDRLPTDQLLVMAGIEGEVDCILAGDQQEVEPKPSKQQIDYICRQVGVDCKDAVMVGDTATDLLMGRNAGVMLTVGMLHGASSLEALEEFADVLVSDLDKIHRLLSLLM